MKFKRFTKPQFLRSIGRERLGPLFRPFAQEVQARGLAAPSLDLRDDDWFSALAMLVLTPERLPADLIETLYVIEELSTPTGQERLEAAVAAAGLGLAFDENSTPGDIAVQVWLARPALVVSAHNEARLRRLSSFEYFGTRQPADRAAAFEAPSAAVLEAITADLQAWFRAHNRGRKSTRVERYRAENEYLFLVRHGDVFTRTAKVDGGRLEVLHFRPAKDDLVIFSPQRDELRIHAGTKGEREAYRSTFGRRLRGSADRFSERMAYTLDPLRTDGADALDPGPAAGIARITLREIEMFWPNRFRESVVRKAKDLFLTATLGGKAAISGSGNLVRAVFDRLKGVNKARRLEVRPPNILRLTRHCDVDLVHQWLTARGFRRTMNGPTISPEVARGQVLRSIVR